MVPSGADDGTISNRRAIDELFATITEINEQIAAADPETARRLTVQRDHLRDRARDMADTRRHPESVAREIEELERRLAAIEALPITQGYSEKYLKTTVQDPGAYAFDINRRIAAEHADDVEEITARLARLRIIASEITGGVGDGDPPGDPDAETEGDAP